MNGSTVRVALIGMGRMGHAIDALAADRACTIVARIRSDVMSAGLTRDALNGAQVAIEFTQPEVAVDNAVACLRAGCPVVIGTTGWATRSAELQRAVESTNVAALWSPNFSIGVQLFLSIAEDAARRLRQLTAFETHVVETHHSAKKDAPSGTGIAIADRLAAGLGHAVPISSVRVGSVPGTHEVIIDAPFEQIRLTHEARDRRVFADGALTAARWLAGVSKPGLYTMQDVLATGSAGA